MNKITKLDYFSSEFSLSYTKPNPKSEDKLVFMDTCGKTVAEVQLLSYREGKGKFRLDNTIHALPFGRYNVSLMAGNCVCGCFPVEIPKCALSAIESVQRANELHCLTEEQPVRECSDESCGCGCNCEDKCCDECTGCHGVNPCDKCHPCYTDHVENIIGKFVIGGGASQTEEVNAGESMEMQSLSLTQDQEVENVDVFVPRKTVVVTQVETDPDDFVISESVPILTTNDQYTDEAKEVLFK